MPFIVVVVLKKQTKTMKFSFFHVCIKQHSVHKVIEKRENIAFLFTKYVDKYSHNSQGQRLL